MTKLQRTTFKTSRAAQYVSAHTLQAMTGQAKSKFADVIAKELLDNALDACETNFARGCYELDQEWLGNAESGGPRETGPTGESAFQCGFHPSS